MPLPRAAAERIRRELHHLYTMDADALTEEGGHRQLAAIEALEWTLAPKQNLAPTRSVKRAAYCPMDRETQALTTCLAALAKVANDEQKRIIYYLRLKLSGSVVAFF